MTDERQGVFNNSLTALSSGVRTLQDPFTYKAVGAATVPIAIVLILGYLFVASPGGSIDALGNLFILGAGWLVVLLVVVFVAALWLNVSVGLRAVTRDAGRELSTGTLLTAAAGRILPTIGAVLLLLLIGVALFLLTLLFAQIAGTALISIIIALLTLPILGAWLIFILTLLVGISYMPGLAAARLDYGPAKILSRSIGIVLAYPAPALMMLVFAGLTALVTLLILAYGLAGGLAVGMGPIVNTMAFEGEIFASALVGAQALLAFFAVGMLPFSIASASIAKFAHMIADDNAVQSAPRQILGLGWTRVRSAAASAGSAAGRLRERLDETASEIGQTPSPAQPTEGEVSYCSQCGAANPSGFKFCRSCGSSASG